MKLTPRQIAILADVAEGLTNRQIAARMFLEPSTVSSHLCILYLEIGASSRAHAVALAFRAGVLR